MKFLSERPSINYTEIKRLKFKRPRSSFG